MHEVINVQGQRETVAIESGTKVEWMQEDTYKFRLSAFRDRLVKWLRETEGSCHGVRLAHADVRGGFRSFAACDSSHFASGLARSL